MAAFSELRAHMIGSPSSSTANDTTVAHRPRRAAAIAVALVGFLFDRSSGDPASTAEDTTAERLTTVVARVYFDRGRAALDASDRAMLASIASDARASGESLTLTGYADATGDKRHNMSLVRDRMTVVQVALVTRGVPESRIIVKSPASVIGTGSDAEARRVEIATYR